MVSTLKKKLFSDEQKKELSEKRKKFLKENPDKHPWKRKDKHKSVPCQNFKNYLDKKGIEYIEEYSPLEDRFYSIDIAFPHIKMGIEINGNHHYNNDGTLKEYYQERHDLIEREGWKLIEVHYSQCFKEENFEKILDFDIPYDDQGLIKEFKRLKKEKNDLLQKRKKRRNYSLIKDDIFTIGIDFKTKKWIKELSLFLNINVTRTVEWMKKYHPEFYERECFKTEKNPVKIKRLKPGLKIQLKTEEKWNSVKDEIFNHEIDFSKHGWVNKVSEIINLSPQKINKWMKKYHPEFYEKECFKRKKIVVRQNDVVK